MSDIPPEWDANGNGSGRSGPFDDQYMQFSVDNEADLQEQRAMMCPLMGLGVYDMAQSYGESAHDLASYAARTTIPETQSLFPVIVPEQPQVPPPQYPLLPFAAQENTRLEPVPIPPNRTTPVPIPANRPMSNTPVPIPANGPMSTTPILPPLPRPGRRPIPTDDSEEPSDRRRDQNRLAQRKFRDNRAIKLAKTLEELESTKAAWKADRAKFAIETDVLRQQVKLLDERVRALQGVSVPVLMAPGERRGGLVDSAMVGRAMGSRSDHGFEGIVMGGGLANGAVVDGTMGINSDRGFEGNVMGGLPVEGFEDWEELPLL